MEYERLSYREIGGRLGITVDAARMKAKREAKAKRWRLIPGNHPNDPVTVEVPVGTLPKRDGEAPKAEPKTDGGWQQFAKDMVARVAELTDQLVAEKDAHARTLAELSAAETRELGTVHELREALDTIAAMKDRDSRRKWIKGRRV